MYATSEFAFEPHLLDRMARHGAATDAMVAALRSSLSALAQTLRRPGHLRSGSTRCEMGRFSEEKHAGARSRREMDTLIALIVIRRLGAGVPLATLRQRSLRPQC